MLVGVTWRFKDRIKHILIRQWLIDYQYFANFILRQIIVDQYLLTLVSFSGLHRIIYHLQIIYNADGTPSVWPGSIKGMPQELVITSGTLRNGRNLGKEHSVTLDIRQQFGVLMQCQCEHRMKISKKYLSEQQRSRWKWMLPCREYLIIHRGPGFLAYTDGRGDGEGGGAKLYDREKARSSINLNHSILSVYEHQMKTIKISPWATAKLNGNECRAAFLALLCTRVEDGWPAIQRRHSTRFLPVLWSALVC